jgi:TPR repeat protein
MLKLIFVSVLSGLLITISTISFANAAVHNSLPALKDETVFDLEYYELKQERCMNAFSISEFEVAYSICTPLANLGFKDAQLITGLLYAYGEGVDKDLNRAKIWLNEALKNGREEAAQALAQFGLN